MITIASLIHSFYGINHQYNHYGRQELVVDGAWVTGQ